MWWTMPSVDATGGCYLKQYLNTSRNARCSGTHAHAATEPRGAPGAESGWATAVLMRCGTAVCWGVDFQRGTAGGFGVN